MYITYIMYKEYVIMKLTSYPIRTGMTVKCIFEHQNSVDQDDCRVIIPVGHLGVVGNEVAPDVLTIVWDDLNGEYAGWTDWMVNELSQKVVAA